MQMSPVCGVCNDQKKHPWNKLWRCCRCRKYICKKHHADTPPLTPSYCTGCYPVIQQEKADGSLKVSVPSSS